MQRLLPQHRFRTTTCRYLPYADSGWFFGPRLRIALKKMFADGTVAVEMDPLSLLTRLAVSLPPLERVIGT